MPDLETLFLKVGLHKEEQCCDTDLVGKVGPDIYVLVST